MPRNLPEPEIGDLIELGAVALQTLLLPLGLGPARVEERGPGHTRPVVLIHGWGANRASMGVLQAGLVMAGFDRVYAAELGPARGLHAQAEALAGYVDRVARACALGRHSLDLVAHSVGGLIARLYLQSSGAARVDRCITLATPHAGSLSPTWGPSGLLPQLRPDSAFIQELNDPARRASGVRYSSLWAERDLAVLPPDSAAYLEGDAVCIQGVGHLGILVHPAAIGQVVARLAAGQSLPGGRLRQLARLTRWLGRAGMGRLTAGRDEPISRNPAGRS